MADLVFTANAGLPLFGNKQIILSNFNISSARVRRKSIVHGSKRMDGTALICPMQPFLKAREMRFSIANGGFGLAAARVQIRRRYPVWLAT